MVFDGHNVQVGEISGGPPETRTPDPLIKSPFQEKVQLTLARHIQTFQPCIERVTVGCFNLIAPAHGRHTVARPTARVTLNQPCRSKLLLDKEVFRPRPPCDRLFSNKETAMKLKETPCEFIRLLHKAKELGREFPWLGQATLLLEHWTDFTDGYVGLSFPE